MIRLSCDVWLVNFLCSGPHRRAGDGGSIGGVYRCGSERASAFAHRVIKFTLIPICNLSLPFIYFFFSGRGEQFINVFPSFISSYSHFPFCLYSLHHMLFSRYPFYHLFILSFYSFIVYYIHHRLLICIRLYTFWLVAFFFCCLWSQLYLSFNYDFFLVDVGEAHLFALSVARFTRDFPDSFPYYYLQWQVSFITLMYGPTLYFFLNSPLSKTQIISPCFYCLEFFFGFRYVYIFLRGRGK